jgi:hypothetical protein
MANSTTDKPDQNRVMVNKVTDATLARLKRYADDHRWSVSTAALDLIERGLEREQQQGRDTS